jgi:hypothetical protein
MRVLKPLTLARRRQLCGTPVPRGNAPLPAESADIFDLREERRAFADQDAQQNQHPPAAE